MKKNTAEHHIKIDRTVKSYQVVQITGSRLFIDSNIVYDLGATLVHILSFS